MHDVVIMYDLHSNSGAIKLNHTGGMLKHLRTGSGIIQAFYFSDPVPLFLVQDHFSYHVPSSVQATFCSLLLVLLLDNEALTLKAATIRSTNLLCGGYLCCKRSARASR